MNRIHLGRRFSPFIAGAWITLLIGTTLVPAQVWADAADDAYSVAAGFYKKERWDLAEDAFKKFLTQYGKHPRAATARFFLGMTQINLQDFKSARDSFRQFVKDSGDSKNAPHAMYRVAECSYLLDDLPAAEAELTAYLNKYPTDTLADRAMPYLADVQLRRNKADVALKTFQQALDKYPEGPMAEDCQFGIAKCYDAQKKPQQALQVYQQLAAKKESARAPEAQLMVGNRYYDLKQYPESAAAFADLEQRFPTSKLVPVARLNRGFALFENRQYAPAAEEFDKAAADPKQVVEARYWQGQSLKGLGQFDKAAELLKQVYESNKEHPLAGNVLYHWADAEQRRGNQAEAEKLFLEMVDRYPESELADDALHLASLAALESDRLDEAEKLATRFSAQFPKSGLLWHQQLIRGRLKLGRRDIAGATTIFQQILKDSQNDTTRHWARYYLGFIHLEQGQPAEALETTEPLIDVVANDPQGRAYISVFLIRGAAQLALANQRTVVNEQREFWQAAQASASRFIELAPQAKELDQALAIRALAAAHGGVKDRALEDLKQLQADFPNSPELEKTTLELAEVAYANEDWAWAQELFHNLAARGPTARTYFAGILGEGWSDYQQKDYAAAEKLFGQLVTESPEHKDAPEAAFMRAKSQHLAGETAAASENYAATLAKYAPSRFAYLAGLESARLKRDLKQYPEADAAYAAVLEKFPQPEHLDKLLNEWALTNYAAENYARSDEIFARLVKETPDSDLADNAKLSLAESELISGKIDQARDKFRELSGSEKSDDQVKQAALYQLVGIALEKKDWDDVEKSSQTLCEKYPASPHRWFAELHWAEAELQKMNLESAQMRLKQVLTQKDNPEVAEESWYPQVWVLLAETDFRLKQYDDVAQLVADLRQAQPESPVLYLLDEILGRALKQQAKFPEAIAAFQRAIEHPQGRRTETAAKAQFLIAEIYLTQKNYTKAEEEYLKVDILYKFPEWQAPALLQAAACQEELKRFSDAVKSYESLLEQFPDSTYAPMAKERLAKAKAKL